MKSIATRFSTLVALGLLLTSATLRADSVVSDPLFGLDFPAAKVPFERAPASVKRCAAMAGRRLWVFARAKAADGDYLVLSGFFKPGPGVQRDPDVSGSLVRIAGPKCAVVGTPEVVLGGKGNEVAPATLAALADDAARRFAQAFGGHRQLRAALQAQHVDLNTVPPLLKQALERAD